MQLSVIIVNYNVCHFLEQCLHSLRVALHAIDAEVWVVDNASIDGSVEHLRPLFPEVHWMVNPENEGFGKANNRALEKAAGDQILFLNPDTLLDENCLQTCLSFMKQNPDAGALGIRMTDGSGRYLPESKRAFPSPLTSLFKLTGLAALFPRSALFARYSLGHLSEHENQEVEVLAGAFLMVRKSILDQIGGFDPRFFMYGEDIDLSYRILQAKNPETGKSWKNYYCAESSIIHFKGESTKRGSLNYVKMFYEAMALFVNKHYGKSRARFFSGFIFLAIVLRAGVSAIARLFAKIGLPLADILLMTLTLLGVWFAWVHWVRPDVIFLPGVLQYALPSFLLVFLLSGAFAGLYSRWYSAQRAFKAMLLATMAVGVVYSLLPETWRFSRGIIFLGGLLSGGLLLGMRAWLVRFGLLQLESEGYEQRQTLVVGLPADYEAIRQLLAPNFKQERLLGRLSVEPNPTDHLMSFDAWLQAPSMLPARSLVFCISQALSMHRVMTNLHPDRANRYIFHYAGSLSVISSSHSKIAGETLALQVNYNLAKPGIRHSKRIVDVGVSLFLLLSFPLHFFLVKKTAGLWRNIWNVLQAKCTWVGYANGGNNLPPLPQGVLQTNGRLGKQNEALTNTALGVLDERYALYYHYWQDLSLIRMGFRFLGG